MILAIDPGMSGGFAWKHPVTCEITCGNLPQGWSVVDLFKLGNRMPASPVLYIEEVPVGMPGRGAAMVKLNISKAFIEGVACAMAWRVVRVRPVKWQQWFSLGKRSNCASDSQWKNKLKAEAMRRFPKIKITLNTSDALLLLEYAIHQERNT